MTDTRRSDIDTALDALRRQAGAPLGERRPHRDRIRRTIRRILLGLLLIVLCLPALVWSSVRLYLAAQWPVWGAFAGGMAGTMTALLTVNLLARHWFFGGRGSLRFLLVLSAGLVVIFSAYTLVAISAGQVKAPGLRQAYGELHPLLRLATGVWFVVDGEAVVTDLGRTASDYDRMGLPVNHRSRHFVQPDGYVHAVDFRTRGASPLRNAVLEGYFAVMGFHTLRHVGTADHLHVSLPGQEGGR